MLKTFPANRIAELRSRASRAAQTPEDCPEDWSISTVDPMNVLAVFRSLRIKDGFVLRAYQFRDGGNGNGFVWAMPVGAAFPDPEECPRLEDTFLGPPKPPAALDNVMDAIDGDGTPWSYMCASILARELSDFGAMWHGCCWGTHTVLGASPWNAKPKDDFDLSQPSSPLSEWHSTTRPPRAWSPRVSVDRGVTTVTFCTYSGLGQEAVYRHLDSYKPGSYRFETERAQMATGPGGYQF